MMTLREYLETTQITQLEFTRRLAVARGYPADQAQVSRWLSGEHLPNQATRRHIELATAGKVPVDAWD